MKKLLFILLILLMCTYIFAMEEKIITLEANDEWSVFERQLFVDILINDDSYLILRFNDQKEHDTWYAIDPFLVRFENDRIVEFRKVLDKFVEWDNVAIQNNVYNLEKDINYRIGAYNFSYVRKSNKSKLFMRINYMNYTESYSFDSYYVKRLKDAISEESLKKFEDKIQFRKKQAELFN